jgi:hypothetical protein
MDLILPTQKLSENQFEKLTLALFKYQAQQIPVYADFLKHINKSHLVDDISSINQIPFLPISFFKTHEVIAQNKSAECIFTSSGTTGQQTSKHLVSDAGIYQKAHRIGFKNAYGNTTDYTVLALLPSYLERDGSSLVIMVDDMINQSGKPESGFYLNDLPALKDKLLKLNATNEKVLLLGVSYALLDLIEFGPFKLNNTIVMETGGMKGKRKEMVKEELHSVLQQGFGVNNIHSEYGMTELLSQAYSKGQGVFETSPTMEVFIRDVNDPFSMLPVGYSGGINVIDLANVNSCAFIATQDLGKKHHNGTFEVLGRFDNSDIRGCNLMVG